MFVFITKLNFRRLLLVLEEHSNVTIGSCAFDKRNSGQS